MSRFNILQQEAYPHKDFTKWLVIDGQRAPSGNPVGIQGKDWQVFAANLTYEYAKRLAANLNDMNKDNHLPGE